MDWKRLLPNSPWTAIAWLSVSCGLLVDFQGAASKVKQVIPILGAFLPLIAIPLTVLSIGWVVVTVEREIRRMLPSYKFGSCWKEIHEFAYFFNDKGVAVVSGSTVITNRSYLMLKDLSETLSRFGIPYPNIPAADPQHFKVWFNYLAVLSPLAKHCDLKKSRDPSSYPKLVRKWFEGGIGGEE